MIEDNFLRFAAEAYRSRETASFDLFMADIKTFESLKSDVSRFINSGTDVTLKIIINKFVICSNMFRLPELLRMLFVRAKDDEARVFWKTLFTYLELMPEELFVSSSFPSTRDIKVCPILIERISNVVGTK